MAPVLPRTVRAVGTDQLLDLEHEAATCGFSQRLPVNWLQKHLAAGATHYLTPEESAGACYTQADNISDRARSHRDILSTALTAAGLVNYPTEWWHWSYGDRYWALKTGAAVAHYGPKELD
jgi:D-alanyl-D-alanine dipeptidase